MYNMPILDSHFEFKTADNRPRTRMCYLPFLDPEPSHLPNLKPNYVQVDIHTEHNPVSRVLEAKN